MKRNSLTLAGWLLATLVFAAAPAVAQTTNPAITSIGGYSNTNAGISNGLVAMPQGTLYNGYRVLNDQPGIYTWTIAGNNFGGSCPFCASGGPV